MTPKIFLQVRKYPVLYNPSHSDYKNSRIREKAWEEIAKVIYGNKWDNLTLHDQVRKAQLLQTTWKTSKERRVLETLHKNYRPSGKVRAVNEDETAPIETALPIKSKTKAADVNDEGLERDVDKDLLVLYLLPIYKLLKNEDKPEMLYHCHKVMKERLDSYSSQQSTST